VAPTTATTGGDGPTAILPHVRSCRAWQGTRLWPPIASSEWEQDVGKELLQFGDLSLES